MFQVGIVETLYSLGVRPSSRSRGAGRQLVEACIDRARAAGATHIGLHTAPFMTAAVHVYETMGFERAPQFDVDVAGPLGFGDSLVAEAYAMALAPPAANAA